MTDTFKEYARKVRECTFLAADHSYEMSDRVPDSMIKELGPA